MMTNNELKAEIKNIFGLEYYLKEEEKKTPLTRVTNGAMVTFCLAGVGVMGMVGASLIGGVVVAMPVLIGLPLMMVTSAGVGFTALSAHAYESRRIAKKALAADIENGVLVQRYHDEIFSPQEEKLMTKKEQILSLLSAQKAFASAASAPEAVSALPHQSTVIKSGFTPKG